MSGTNIDPSTAVLADAEPVKTESPVPEATANSPSLPGTRPTHLSRVSMVRMATPEWNNISHKDK